MIVKSSESKRLEGIYEKSGNQLVVLYGRKECEKEALLNQFTKDKKTFYYRARNASELEQRNMFGQEVAGQYGIRIQKNTYDEFFQRVKSGNPTKLVVIIDEFQLIAKKDETFFPSVGRLKDHKLYPGPVMIILASSSIQWVEQDMAAVIESGMRKIDERIKLEELNFLEVVRAFPKYQVSDCIEVYGVLGGVPGYLNRWNPELSTRENICRLILSPEGYLFHEADQVIRAQLRELSVYSTILAAIAGGHNKLNDLYQKTGFSRAKISVYMKNLAKFDIVEKLVSFETGGWDNAKKGVYQIRDTYVNFWFRFVYPHLSDLYRMKPEEFYDTYIQEELDAYLNRYFRNVCMEYLVLLNQIGRLPIRISKMGTWVGKTGNIDIIAQDTARNHIVGLCNWEKSQLTLAQCQELFDSMKMAKIQSSHFYLFSAREFEPALVEKAKTDKRYTLIDMNEL